MKLSKNPLDWIVLVIAVVTFVVAVIAAADFSGKPAPKWREPLVMTGLAFGGVRGFFLWRRAKRAAERSSGVSSPEQEG